MRGIDILLAAILAWMLLFGLYEIVKTVVEALL